MRFMMQDSIMAAGKVCTAGSKMLYNFKAPLSAAVYEKCLEKGMEFGGFTLPCEFGADSLFDSLDGPDPAVTALLEDKCDAVLCNDVFGKLRRQAPLNGLIYIQPAYGTVSRYGLIGGFIHGPNRGALPVIERRPCRSFGDIKRDSFDGTSLPDISHDYNRAGRRPSFRHALANRLAGHATASESS